MRYDLSGTWTARLADGTCSPIRLPGTLDENGIGEKDEGKNQWHPDITLGNLGLQAKEDHVIATRYTRKVTWEGPVELRQTIREDLPEGERMFLEAERARVLNLCIDGREVPHFRTPCLNTPQVFEVTGLWKKGGTVCLTADNSYPGLPKKAILNSSAATDETQTNWNGILGYLRLRTEKSVFVERLSVYPYGDSLKVRAELNSDREWSGTVTVRSDALKKAETMTVSLHAGRNRIEFPLLTLAPEVIQWDEEEGNLCSLSMELSGEGFCRRVELPETAVPAGELTDAGQAVFSLEGLTKPVRLNLKLSLGDIKNSYPVWVYPPVKPVCPDGIYETDCLDEKARKTLRAGGKVYLAPRSIKEDLPRSVQAQFTTDFWSVGTFDGQEGCMGQLIDDSHPLFREFPTEFHTNWQWWPMAVQRAVILPEHCRAIVTEMDSYAWLRPMAQLFEFRCGGGSVLFSSMGLQDLQQYPEARALLAAIYHYMDSGEFLPEQELSEEELEMMVRVKKT